MEPGATDQFSAAWDLPNELHAIFMTLIFHFQPKSLKYSINIILYGDVKERCSGNILSVTPVLSGQSSVRTAHVFGRARVSAESHCR